MNASVKSQKVNPEPINKIFTDTNFLFVSSEIFARGLHLLMLKKQ